ncbi:geranylgeranylglycerol-phosphate geranylgeranyltransferase [Flavobacterium branchiophilum]|uniref:Prenyltransferase family protein n=2 Tax=Flavobacterium branchiophilum TaxID=55197 RepID=G2Z2R5_FLABF|nr:geranylgeranylglycerol-phosphate geranylgeranyltransferase [Flavobacterium branchiophilum]PDS23697.1 ubiquinone biosynthesis protein UbiA [Flavobacterium branchiophilum]CCB70244.1 Prenyltransferase family protein [Flavobacterium branchiophilum FL-15]
MLSRKSKWLILKFVSLFSVVRAYNIIVIILAQYLAAIFILAPEVRALSVILDVDLFILVLASSMTIASGYIINNFYDSQKDLINRPNKSKLDRLVSQSTKLQVYFGLNFLVAIIAFIVSWRAVLFYSTYIFLIWIYCHKFKKIPFVGNILASILAVLPFFGILLYFKNFYEVIFFHASFLFLLILVREMIKDLENMKGDFANNYLTIPNVYGENWSKRIIISLLILTVIPVYFLVNVYSVGYMDIYFYMCFIFFIYLSISLWKAHTQEAFLNTHNILKVLILAGVFSIILIEPSVLIHGRNYILGK